MEPLGEVEVYGLAGARVSLKMGFERSVSFTLPPLYQTIRLVLAVEDMNSPLAA